MNKQQSCKGLRALLIGPYPPPFGGIASHLTTLIPGLLSRGASDICVISFGARDEVVYKDGAIVYYFYPKKHIRNFLLPKNWKALFVTITKLARARIGYRQVLEEAIKTILINNIADKHQSNAVGFYKSDQSFSILPCSHLWKERRGILLTVFGELYDNPGLWKGREAFLERLLTKPHKVAASSNHCACSFDKILGIKRKIQSVYYGIDLHRFAASDLRDSYRKELGFTPEDVLLVFMGRFTEEMGINRLIEIGPQLLQQGSHIKLLLAGAKGPLADSAAVFARQYPEQVRILHDIPFDLQPALYAASDIVLAPSHDQHACMGMSIKEAMAASRPVIGSRAGGIPEAIIHGETGLLVPLDATKHIDSAELMRAISQLVADPEMRTSMGKAARQRAEDIFPMERTIDKLGQMFTDIMPA